MKRIARLRHLMIAAALLAVTLATCGVVITRPGVYWARSSVLLIAPAVQSRPNNLQDGSGSLVSLAGIVERQMSGRSTQYNPNGPDVTIVDRGITNGITVRVPNFGGQWATNFSQPVLDVEASGPTPEIVQQRMVRTFAEIEAKVRDNQQQLGVDASQMITTSISPRQLQVRFSDGSRGRAAGTVLLIGGALSVAALLSPLRRRTVPTTAGALA
ncbi:hypothetical protein FHX74_000287 [Friedmanniella endophytica]|uniref:Capsular polysaccharide biosynthesis protein n=1 Tax=Microlunatus kandeliicorticis TaxID=1759536 RepID=A0A7W3IP65_9ACTN|nr:hypothetical protein [Microlunatus kandeliicorticis]MBA8792693.1 hypothetical protein [Microlunatus kandeliicorticis]